MLLLLPSTSCSPVILDSPRLTRAGLRLAAAPQQAPESKPGADSRRGRWAGISWVYPLTGQRMISNASAEAVDGGPSEKAGSALLALTARGGATPQLPAKGSWRLLTSRAKREQHLIANTTMPFSARAVCSCGQHFLPWKCSQLWAMQRQQRSSWHEVDRETPGSP